MRQYQMSLDRPDVKIGCCGFRMSRSEYMRHYPVVEVQHTFYQPPKLTTLEQWREGAPKGFEFTLKAWQLITHEARSPTYRRLKRELTEAERAQCGAFRPTAIVREALATTLACAEALKAKCILFQCPASFTPTPRNVENLREFFSNIKRKRGQHLCWEPRGDWPVELIRTLCRELKLAHVVDPFKSRTVTPDLCYFRLHGRTGFRYSYEDDELEELLEMLPHARTSYVFFNNVRMREDAARMIEKLSVESH
ncbi:MAG: DUF72 domain-containing protein [Pyrinomonadaceae bacterium]